MNRTLLCFSADSLFTAWSAPAVISKYEFFSEKIEIECFRDDPSHYSDLLLLGVPFFLIVFQ